jgi:tRNA/rRNA methyltransferase
VEGLDLLLRQLGPLFQRAELTEQEIQTLHGIVKELSTMRVRRGRPE